MKHYHDHNTLEILRKLRQGWGQACRNKRLNMNSPMPAPWHLGVTLRGNDPDVTADKMKAALEEWVSEINRAALGEQASQTNTQRWCWIASYQPGSNDEQIAPQWKLIMTTGYDVKAEKARELLAEVRVDRHVGDHIVRGCQRALHIEYLFAEKWRQVMPNGSIIATAFNHPAEEAAWINDMIRDVAGKRFSELVDARMVYDSIQLGGQIWEHKTQLH
jgi:hypothetical protein